MSGFVIIPPPSINNIVVNGKQEINRSVYLYTDSVDFSSGSNLPNLPKSYVGNLTDKSYTSCVHNGEIHIFGNDSSVIEHYKYSFEDSMWIKLNDIPGSASDIAHYRAFSLVADGKLHLYDVRPSSLDKLYEYWWDEENDTWLTEEYMEMPDYSELAYIEYRDMVVYHLAYTDRTFVYCYFKDSSDNKWYRYYKYYDTDGTSSSWYRSSVITRFTLTPSKGIIVPLLNESTGSYNIHIIGANSGYDHVGYINGAYREFNEIYSPYRPWISQAFIMNNNIYAKSKGGDILVWNESTDTWKLVCHLDVVPTRMEVIGDTIYAIGGDEDHSRLFKASATTYKMDIKN